MATVEHPLPYWTILGHAVRQAGYPFFPQGGLQAGPITRPFDFMFWPAANDADVKGRNNTE